MALSNKNKRKYFDAQKFVNRQIERRTNAALKKKNAQFAADHAHDSKAQLLEHLRQCAQELGHTPHKEEIIGGAYIGFRFEGYTNAVTAAGLPLPGRLPAPAARKIYREELKVQTELYRKEKAAEKAQRAADRFEKSRIAQAEHDARKERDAAWGEEHKDDSDEQLMAYVRACAKELGHSPYTKEIVGGEYIRSRFGSWSVVLTVAGIPLAPDMKPPEQNRVMEHMNDRKVLL